MLRLGVKQYGSSLYCILPSSVLQYIADFVKNHFMGTSCTQLHMFYVANKSRESETSAYYNLYAFVCHFIFQSATQTTQYLAIYCNILQYAIYQYSLLAILYCIAIVNIAI